VGLTLLFAVWQWGAASRGVGPAAPANAEAVSASLVALDSPANAAALSPGFVDLAEDSFATFPLPGGAELYRRGPPRGGAGQHGRGRRDGGTQAAPSLAARGALPFRTQRDGSQWAGSNCGPAALAMVLASYGVEQGNDEPTLPLAHLPGHLGRRGGTALQHLAQVAEDFGVRAVGLYDQDHFHQWTTAELRDEVAPVTR